MRVRVKLYHWLPRLIRVDGITLYPYVLCSGGYEKTLLNHEFIHVAQVRRQGWFGFYLIYLFDWMRLSIKLRKHAYFEIPAEVEAFNLQREASHPALVSVDSFTLLESKT
jgi:hypothetical protein